MDGRLANRGITPRWAPSFGRLALALLAAGVLAACSGGSSGGTSPAAPSTFGYVSPSDTAALSDATATGGTQTGSATAGAPSTLPLGTATTTPPASGTGCAPASLELTLGRMDGAAGHLYQEVVFRNVSGTACTLNGFPGVSFLDSAGKALGLPAMRDTSQGSGSSVQIAANETAYSIVALPNVGVYGTLGSAPCSSAHAVKIKIFPPAFTTEYLLPDAVDVCTTSTGRGMVRPVAAGRMP